MIEVVPAIIPENYEELANQIERVYSFVSTVQIDVIDGKYAPPTTWPMHPEDAPSFRRIVDEEVGLPYFKQIQYEIDFMVLDPEQYFDEWMNAGATTAIIHARSTQNLGDAIDLAKGMGMGVAVALLPSDDPSLIDHFVRDLSFVQLMGNDKIGYHGVSLDEEKVFAHIETIRQRYPDLPISIDIGVSEETAPRLVNAGVSKLVSGSALFRSEDIAETIERFKHLG